jgi:hypothetical protein
MSDTPDADHGATPAALRLNDQLGPAVNRALFADECQRLSEWALIGPVQRAALESFAERLLAAERERCAKLCDDAKPRGGRMWTDEQAACFDCLTHVATAIRA